MERAGDGDDNGRRPEVILTLGLFLAAAVAAWIVPPRYRLAVWLLAIVVIVVPWRTFQTHTHWDRVQWIPLVSPPVRPHDLIGNVALYVPFGLLYAQRERGSLVACIGWACLLAATTESTQLYSHGRYPSVQDVLMNVAGAALGVVWARSRAQRRGNRMAADLT